MLYIIQATLIVLVVILIVAGIKYLCWLRAPYVGRHYKSIFGKEWVITKFTPDSAMPFHLYCKERDQALDIGFERLKEFKRVWNW